MAQDSTKGKAVSTKTSTIVKDTTIRGVTYQLYKSVHDKYFIVRTSAKTGNQYKQYLK